MLTEPERIVTMNNTDLGGLMDALSQIAVAAGQKLLQQSVTVNSHKSRNDLLTENDLWTETFIIDELKKQYPNVHIVSEEYNPDNVPQGLSVVIDPIDGTCNYAAGLPLFGIQLAIFLDNVCIGAILYFPSAKKLYLAQKGQGATVNGAPLKVNQAAAAGDGMLLISDYYDAISIPFDKQFALVKALQSSFLKTRHMGAACVDFSMLAEGNGLAYVTYYHKIWDIAPGLLLAQEAGCVYGAVDADSYEYGRPGLVVANNEENLQLILRAYQNL